MATNTQTVCDHCGKPIKSQLRGLFGGPSNHLSTDAMQIALAIPPEKGRTYRDLCNEHCLRDFLVKNVPAETYPIFVFLDQNRPKLITRGWMHYWHPDKRWVTEREVTQEETTTFEARKLKPEHARLYNTEPGWPIPDLPVSGAAVS